MPSNTTSYTNNYTFSTSTNNPFIEYDDLTIGGAGSPPGYLGSWWVPISTPEAPKPLKKLVPKTLWDLDYDE